MDYPHMMYRGMFESPEALQAAWNAQTGIEQATVGDEVAEAAAAELGYVNDPAAMVGTPKRGPGRPKKAVTDVDGQ